LSRNPSLWGFNSTQKTIIVNLLKKYVDEKKLYGSFSGHLHRHFAGTSFDELKNFKQWETDGNLKGPTYSLIRVSKSKIVSEKHIKI
jgi:hypothetical protein